MKISKLWLDKFFDAPLPSAEVLSHALTFHAFEIDGIDKVGSDDVLDVKVTPNRGHDCLSHRGIAKELSAILKLPLAHDPFTNGSDISKITSDVTVKIDTPLCKRYIAGYIKGVKVGPSPKWLKERLEAIGQRSINNVVDATNFVMFNTGQPLHAFDAGKLYGGPSSISDMEDGPRYSIGVRAAHDGEVLIALDKKEYTLNSSMLVITAADKPVGIAGVKGGSPAAIDESTTDIVIESANFDGVSVRKTAAALKLRTDASARYEQGISPELCARGMEGMIEFIAHQIGGTIEGFVDVYPTPQAMQYASVTVEKVNQVLGTNLTGADVADVFVRLGFAYKEEQSVFEVQIPPERLDITIAEDLVEEVVRIIGYEAIKGVQLPPIDKQPEVNKDFYAAEAAREDLVNKGYSEVFTSVFADKGERVVLNKVDGVKPYLRATLLPGLTDALAKNKPNKELLGLKEIKLFEIGTVWKGGKEVTMLGTISENPSRKSGAEAEEKPTEMELVGQQDATEYQT
ncbi:MAG TPA: phenylalanine--tRNA ligase subunit beta, partial [Candidatus Paceibacterota bacterium]|nr:phenylalanine--tRNA ligase subunit beta [Candidatus Paceibacterota bacterium]